MFLGDSEGRGRYGDLWKCDVFVGTACVTEGGRIGEQEGTLL